MQRIIADNAWSFFIGGLFLSYLLGSLPSAYLLGRLLKGIDIRKFGSGNVGATNTFRVLGRSAGIVVLTIDILKGIIPVVFIGDCVLSQATPFNPEITRVILGLAAVIGHSLSVFLKFKGGKGVAATFGVMLGLAIKIPGFQFVLISSLMLWLGVLFFSRMVSVASISMALGFPVLMLFFKQPAALTWIGIFFSAFIILRHLPNIKRLIKKEEPRLK